MAEVTNEPMFETLKDVQGRLMRMDGKLDELSAETRVVKAHVAGLVGADVIRESTIAELRERVERIERRLDLVD